MKTQGIFDDILKLTQMTFDEIKNSRLSIRKILYYDLYRALHAMNCEFHVVLEHYLALTFEEEFLVQTTSYNSAEEKWRDVFNSDLTRANSKVQSYLFQLQYLSYDDQDDNLEFQVMQKGPLDEYINHKNFYGALLAHYSCGLILENSCTLQKTVINFQEFKNNPIETILIDLSTYEKRLDVKKEGLAVLKQLIVIEEEVKAYLIANVSINDLVLEVQELRVAKRNI